MRHGILGGTFDPIHTGHIEIALAAKRQFDLQMLWFMPAKIPPHKQNSDITDDVHRLMMVQHSIPSDEAEMNVMEFAREGVSYTSDTLTMLKNEHPDAEIYYIMGEDSLRDFPKWHEPEKIAKLAKIAVAIREESVESFRELLAERNEQYGGAFIPLTIPYQPISSTMLREALAAGEEPLYLAPRAYRYIRRFGLYDTVSTAIRPETKKLYDYFVPKLREKLSPHRFRHCTGVAHLAADLLQEYAEVNCTPDADGYYTIVQQGYIAGLLHDCAKYMPFDTYPDFCREHGISFGKETEASPEVLHANVGRYLAEHTYGIKDETILRAIEVHCVGGIDMDEVSMAVYTADFCEPFRDHRPLLCSLQNIRDLAYQDLTKAALLVTDCALTFIKSNNYSVDSRTELVLENLQKKAGVNTRKEETKMDNYTSKDLAMTAYAALDSKKAFDIRVIQIDKVSTIADYFVIADGNNSSQVEAMVDEVQMMFHKKYDLDPKRIEGAKNSGWILLDYGDIVVHVFSSQDRLFYDLERVWRDGAVVDTEGWNTEA
ncbi:MAG: nicotinate (nicotinamide) nucleotide adenylyltransferase [Lachnospiraceae bacterium]|nr:nicotinate (nicotinamide) nucleotide adenylyltransferase [Lachnospiraceae bacterium]